ncbi:MAG: YbhB/YbcL family Raf kinase inhibitor-like protein [Stagnimonas sp.]|nr:YbhB/YbcL family Raf kinase inhibitor-like protein [Stagnimonas sp.]
MKLLSDTFEDGGIIPGRCGFCVKDPKNFLRLSQNLSPQLEWRGAPEETQSFVLVCIDPDAPATKPDYVNTPGKLIPARYPRGNFVHWILVDIASTITQLGEGDCSRAVIPGGKRIPDGPDGSRQGLNDYTAWFAGDKNMEGPYLGYDGPCPPFNDSIPHRYVFTLYALDVPTLAVSGSFTLTDVTQALRGHVLAEATITGRYATNPDIRLK